ncbi:NAD(P)-dependent oxidoreductase [Sulfitobacter mediterraneus]|uniref:3-hydroxyisobutyrate dehydrogenase n=1 Tax=Sulfitobacter mediterraneus TaxID=83219 RepID=A0A061SRZ3_9RHOB|nr:NAD(P)-binding domain-containing protein [Sulfitobacter mediterraneus]KAJ02149.1 3-hydroxyisobutyrate dehydrogenase [Sulfitobacter mediterraneus]MBM1557783.1 NAD(P)-dependent oxidoreductase [Sulfitobacter mediterraneus]MBM1568842.1 NAD(P)-dependent oxidoreductase [Sulfitobacter mediterraneus]MBM1572956.1 NAD(P)-dependent oxidoreductase [Sulfitobacter mediterraneus]MBM1576157.1 NAD(P)-dependent oxidoreductase [Sulfitobacter mediterraneus]
MITVAGCGRMGGPMLAALRVAGFDAKGFDVRPMDQSGVTNDLTSLYDQTEILLTVVRDIAQTDAVLFEDQRFAAAPRLKTVIINSTLSPRYVRALQDKIPAHIALIDAPMSGAKIAAQEARLSFMLGGAETDLDAAQPLFDAMGAHFHRMGDFGSGMQAKVLNNLLAASNTAMTRLVLNWADAAGLDERKLLDLIHTSSGQNWFASGFDEIEFARDGLSADNTIGILVKDVQSALDAAPEGADLSLPQTVQTQIGHLTPRK